MERLRTLSLRLLVWLQLLSPKRFAALASSLVLALGAVVPVLADEDVARAVVDVATAVVYGE
ncbi:hypothetical protein [Streptomyces sp. R44]|uniref:Uncharacterized protein n=1 Tax=Streptomyces sp. R44 TaxID=3238633 RepID=A0AB39T5M0_9ACTN